MIRAWSSGHTVGARVVRLGRTSLTLEGALYEADHCAATAEVVGVLINLETRVPTELPPELRERLGAFL